MWEASFFVPTNFVNTSTWVNTVVIEICTHYLNLNLAGLDRNSE